MKQTHITIGIPAYNEEKNIDHLLHALERQYFWGMHLDAILVISDGSTDHTEDRVRSVRNRKIRYILRKTRKGINATLNEIFSTSESEVLILVNADVEISNRAFLHELVHLFRQNNSLGIVGANVVPLKPKTMFESILTMSHNLKKYIYDRINQGNNIYNCHGRGRAIGKGLYKSMRIPDDCPEDAYAYLDCISKGYRFLYQKDAVVRFRSPQNLADHVKQSIRFSQGKTELKAHFSEDRLIREYTIPRKNFIQSVVRFAVKYPFHMAAYIILQCYITLRYKNIHINQTKFEPAYSSKALV